MGTILILGALGFLYVGLFGMPAVRAVPRDRVAYYTHTESKPLLTKVADSLVSGVEKVMSRRGWRPFTAEELELAGIRSSIASLVVLVTCLGFIAFAGSTVLLGNAVVGLVIAFLMPVLAKAYIGFKAGRRRKKFGEQLAPLLSMLASSLRAGHSLPRAMDAAAAEAESPMAEELGRVVNEYRLGRDLVEAMEQVADRMHSEDFRWIGGAIEAQRETGGNLNEILDQVAETIRERQHIRMQVMSLSAEGRLSAYILMALPVFIGVYYGLVQAELMGLFIGSGIGKILILVAAVMYTIGGFWMRSIVRIEF
ncbi:type II secretion system F family protein [Aeromicrobium sp. Root495]|uniref:type II secretion system F family protein n=1 Tax=Aeromicrobium sp. Root495 TaxID=1736550 RepID=UPI00138F6DAE|nr:type II secretion system F family protein [Aeromicrobium sp. Root495]